jgi:hypothetical protein
VSFHDAYSNPTSTRIEPPAAARLAHELADGSRRVGLPLRALRGDAFFVTTLRVARLHDDVHPRASI